MAISTSTPILVHCASEGEHQVQLNAGSQGGHLHADGRAKGKAQAENGRVKVQHNIQNTMEITCM